MGRIGLAILIGIALGIGGTLLVVKRSDGPEVSPGADPEVAKLAEEKAEVERELAEIRKERDGLRDDLGAARTKLTGAERKIAELESCVMEEEEEPPSDDTEQAGAPVTAEELEAGARAFGASLQAIILGEGGEDAVAELKDLFARAEPGAVQALIDRFESPELGMGPKTVLAHALAQSGNPAALKALQEVLEDPDRGMIDRRTAAHGLAFSPYESVVPTLYEAAENDPDRGARANAAFGLARRGKPRGVELYAKATDDAFAANDPAAIQYLSGFALLGEKAVPVMRERLTTYEDPQAKIVLIQLLTEQKDADSIPVLRGMVNDPGTVKNVRVEAETAIRKIESQD